MAKSSIPFGGILCWDGDRIAVVVWVSSLGSMGGGLVRMEKGGFFGGGRETILGLQSEAVLEKSGL